MCCEHLICANCSGPVSEGGCNVCRGSRERMGHHDEGGGISVTAMAALIVALTIAVALLTSTMH
jgi:hypothetical protein